MKSLQKGLFLVWSLLLFISTSQAQEKLVMTKATQKEMLGNMIKLLHESYVFPEVAKKMESHLHSQLKKGAYKDIQDPYKFAEVLSKELVEVANDRHIGIKYAPKQIAQMRAIIEAKMYSWLF